MVQFFFIYKIKSSVHYQRIEEESKKSSKDSSLNMIGLVSLIECVLQKSNKTSFK